MATKVGIVGAGITPFKARWYEKTYYELAQMATVAALKDAGISIKIERKLWVSKNSEFTTIFKLERMARSLARTKKS